ncbi:MAG: RNA polymerase sigma factor [Bacteroidales bacterium]|nr:RNA polymerase sigma factor [Bacteroidales bacterium]
MAERNDSGRTGELIENCRKGDRKAQFEIYRLYYKAMYNTCLRIVSQPVEAEDIIQEAFLSAFSKISTYKGTVSFGAWLKRIVINKSIDALRQQRIRFEEITSAEQDDIQEGIIEVEDDGRQQVEVLVQQIKKAIQELPRGYRVVLTLALIEGYDHEEIARLLSVSESTSRSQLARARKKLIEIIKSKQK